MRRTQLIGLLLWRAGLLFAGAWAFYESARRVLRFFTLPRQVEIALGLGLAGAALVVVSLILERVRDARAEGDLRE